MKKNTENLLKTYFHSEVPADKCLAWFVSVSSLLLSIKQTLSLKHTALYRPLQDHGGTAGTGLTFYFRWVRAGMQYIGCNTVLYCCHFTS